MGVRDTICTLLKFAFLTSFIFAKCHNDKFTVAFEWNFINYTSASPGSFVPGEDIIAGIKIYKDTIYLALPRIKASARVTLASLPIRAGKRNPLLRPYPNWEMNLSDSCEALQNVLSMEIDTDGIMWVLDAKRDNDKTKCPPRIVLLDLNNAGAVVQNFIVPTELCPHEGCFLNDIVVDGDYAYMSDTTQSDPGIFVYNRVSNKAWKFRDPTMKTDPLAENFTVGGLTRTGPGHINGIALSPNCQEKRTFYYMAQAGLNIFSIGNYVLKNQGLSTENISEFITDHGRKQGQSGGMMCDDAGEIYYGLLPLDAVGKWDTRGPLQSAVIVEQNHEIIKWPDSFSFDDNGNLYLITNNMLYFSLKAIDVHDINFRIIKLHTGTKSYYHCNAAVIY